MTEPNLLPCPCPFCNGTNFVYQFLNDEGQCEEGEATWIELCCDALQGGCGASSGCRESQEEVIALWNTRAPLTPAQKLEAVREFMDRCLADTSEKSFLEVAEIALAEMEGGVH